jgi:hypothetical protein
MLSPSQVSTFLGCGAKYRFKYLLGFPDPAAGGAVRSKAIHKAIENYMRATIAGVILDAENLIYDWDVLWDSAAEGAEFAAHENIDALKQSGFDLAAKYLREVAPEVQPRPSSFRSRARSRASRSAALSTSSTSTAA